MVHRKVCTVLYKKKWDFVMHIFFNVLRSGVSLEIIDIYLKRIFLCKLQKKTNIFHFFFYIFSDADDAVHDMDGKDMQGGRVRVELARDPRDRGGRGGGGRFGKFIFQCSKIRKNVQKILLSPHKKQYKP